jgi:hypothetical protein
MSYTNDYDEYMKNSVIDLSTTESASYNKKTEQTTNNVMVVK